MSEYVEQHKFDAGLTLLGHPNVLLSKTQADFQAGGNKLHTNLYLYRTLSSLVINKPGWRFVATGSAVWGGERVITQFTVRDGDETLGKVGIAYRGRNYKIIVENDRIDAKRTRNNGYATDDPDRAALAIRKHFYRLEPKEQIEKQSKMAKDFIAKQLRSHSYEYNNLMGAAMSNAEAFVRGHALTQYLTVYPAAKSKIDAALKRKVELDVVDAIRKKFDSGDAVLVVLRGAEYLIEDAKTEGVKTFSSEDFPHELRARLGILKLVEDGQCVSDTGCRVNASTFVVLKEQQDDGTSAQA